MILTGIKFLNLENFGINKTKSLFQKRREEDQKNKLIKIKSRNK